MGNHASYRRTLWLLTAWLSTTVAGAIALTAVRSPSQSTRLHRLNLHARSDENEKAEGGADLAKYWLLRRGLQFGVPQRAYEAAVSQMKNGLRTLAPFDPSAWNNVGPVPMNNALPNFGGAIAGATFNATGRVTAIAADPTTQGTFYVGAANGGVWMTNDGGNTFTPIADTLPTQAIGAIAIDAVNSSPPTLYVATGEGNAAIESYYGQGVFMSRDMGVTWTPLSPGTFDRAAFSRLAIDTSHNPAYLFAAATPFVLSAGRADPGFPEADFTKGGLWRSQDGGNTWTQYPGSTFNCFIAANAPCPAQDVVIDSQDPNHVCASIEFDNVFCSFDGGNTWQPATLPGIPPGLNHMNRVTLAVGPPAANAPTTCVGGTAPCGVLYAMVGALSSEAYLGFFMSTDGGVTWTAQNVPSWPNPNGTIIDGTSPNNFSQEFYDQTLMVSPTDPATVFFGGVGIYVSSNSGITWSFLPQNGGTHSDQHALAIAPDNDTVYLGNDGGAYSFNISGITGGVASFTSLNSTLNAGQIQVIGPHPTIDATVLAGFQDNGTNLYTGTPNWNQVETGDGGFTIFAPTNPSMAYHTFAAGGQSVLLGISSDGGNTWSHAVAPVNFAGDSVGFYPPLAADPTNPQRLLMGGHKVYALDFSTGTVFLQSPQDLTGGGCGNCALQDLEFASNTSNTLAWALSMQNGATPFKLSNTTQANLNNGAVWNDVTSHLPFSASATQATGIAPDPNNVNNAVLSVSGFTAKTGVGHVFKTTDFGATWTRADGAGGASPLPDVPVLRVLVDKQDATSNTLLAATDIGVFRSTDGGATWAAYNLGTIPAVPVFDIQQNNNGTIFIGTHGRGAYQLMR
jgi:photosystem II stability/assembly factor-like uncharacterized protein